ncbi:hypothetical protein [Pectobacterium phage Jarilo]|uniref:Uncharacterized protein n=1 Tax=Pectobacterium phage Jarilo TaxID=2163634 RepID=A0A2S1GSY5_9CAUD|nr:hypothetical protein HOT17_gp29 [Pectobacterium phage Jarilo]AWD92510.1 hypothetical protein [Pectobacterium phage Jarilo]
MCFSPKVKTPQIDTNAVKAIDPAPLTEEPKGVLFGGQEDSNTSSSEVGTGSSKDAAKVSLTTPKATTTSPKANSGVKKSITNKAFGR